eukprot:gene21426-27456_t
MRITKKYTGNLCIGKRTFSQKITHSQDDLNALTACYQRLEDLRRVWINKLLLGEQWHARKMSTASRLSVGKSPFDNNTENKQVNTTSSHNAAPRYQYFNHPSLDATSFEMTPSQKSCVGLSPPAAFNSNILTQNSSSSSVTSGSNYISNSFQFSNYSGRSTADLVFNEDYVRRALLPYVSSTSSDTGEGEALVRWLRSAHQVVHGEVWDADGSNSQSVLTKLSVVCGPTPTTTMLYKVLLSCCVGDQPRLHSAVQAVFEREIVRSNSTIRDFTQMSSGVTPSATDGEGGGGKRMRVEMMSEEQRGEEKEDGENIVDEEGDEEEEESRESRIFVIKEEEDDDQGSTLANLKPSPLSILDWVFPAGSQVAPADAPPISEEVGQRPLSLEDCLRSMQQRQNPAHNGLIQGPISARASQYIEQQQQRISSSSSPVDLSSLTTIPVPHLPLNISSCLMSPSALQAQLSLSLDQSIHAIAAMIVQQQTSSSEASSGPVDQTQLATAAEALMDLVQHKQMQHEL